MAKKRSSKGGSDRGRKAQSARMTAQAKSYKKGSNKGKAAVAGAVGAAGAGALYGAAYKNVYGNMVDSGRSSFTRGDVNRNIGRAAANTGRNLYARLTGSGLPGLKGK